MANKILTKKSSTAGVQPTAADLDVGELAVNTSDGTLFTKHSDGSVKAVGSSPTHTHDYAPTVHTHTNSIDHLTDVDVTTTAPTADQVLKYDGTNWIPGDDVAGSGGTGGTTNLTAGVIWDNHSTTAYDYTNDGVAGSSGTTATDITVEVDKTAVLTHAADSEELRSVYIEKYVDVSAEAVPTKKIEIDATLPSGTSGSFHIAFGGLKFYDANGVQITIANLSLVSTTSATFDNGSISSTDTYDNYYQVGHILTGDATAWNGGIDHGYWLAPSGVPSSTITIIFTTPISIVSFDVVTFPNYSNRGSDLSVQFLDENLTELSVVSAPKNTSVHTASNSAIENFTTNVPTLPGTTYWQLETFNDWGVQFTDPTTTTITNNTGADATARFRITAPTASAGGSGGGATTLAELTDSTTATTDPLITSNLTVGHFWINSTSGEAYVCTDATADANVWTNIGAGAGDVPAIVDIEGLIIAGGGGGGGSFFGGGGGGGAGGVMATSASITPGAQFTIIVGDGGASNASGTDSSVSATSGVFGTQLLTTVTAFGGGCGGTNVFFPLDGGSGGGGGCTTGSRTFGASGTTGQGNAGGDGRANASSVYSEWGGGGGGFSTAGEHASSTSGGGGDGGLGLDSDISGAANQYAGGGGGGIRYASTAGVGVYGGGNGAASGVGSAGTPGTGGGGGGGSFNAAGGVGGSGVVILRYSDVSDPASATTGSPIITVDGGYRVYVWTTSGTITF